MDAPSFLSAHPTLPDVSPDNEPSRIQALKDLSILDTPPEERFDRITRLARRLFDLPVALVHLQAEDRLWLRSPETTAALPHQEERDLCERIEEVPQELLLIPDVRERSELAGHPAVAGDPGVRFLALAPVRAPDGHVLGVFCVMDHEPRALEEDDRKLLRDLADLVEREFAALELATIDELTGLSNRRGFNAIALHTLALCRRSDREATLVLFDLDGFCQVNETLGHQAGDEVLKGFADDLEETFRDSDVVSRLGADEFAVLFSGAAPEDLRRPLAMLGIRVQTRNDTAGNGTQVSYSLGVAGYDPDLHHDVGDLALQAARTLRDRRELKRTD